MGNFLIKVLSVTLAISGLVSTDARAVPTVFQFSCPPWMTVISAQVPSSVSSGGITFNLDTDPAYNQILMNFSRATVNAPGNPAYAACAFYIVGGSSFYGPGNNKFFYKHPLPASFVNNGTTYSYNSCQTQLPLGVERYSCTTK